MGPTLSHFLPRRIQNLERAEKQKRQHYPENLGRISKYTAVLWVITSDFINYSEHVENNVCFFYHGVKMRHHY